MTKAYDYGARRLWVVNVGDIKPIEAGTTLFMELAWNVERYGPDVQRAFLRDFYTRQFGQEHGETIAELKDEYFRLCAMRRPEHLGFNRVYPNAPAGDSEWSDQDAERVLQRWLDLCRRAEAIAGELPEPSREAYFQLVEYPACAGAAMAEKLIAAEQARETGSSERARRAEGALKRIEQLTERYNAQRGGKWRHMMNHRPRKLPVFDMPPTTRPAKTTAAAASAASSAAKREVVEIDATQFVRSHDRDGSGWRVIEGLGPRGAAIALLPRRAIETLRSPEEIVGGAPVAEYPVEAGNGGEIEITVEALPTHRLTPAHEVLAAVSIDDQPPAVVRFARGEDHERDPTWQTNVLRGAMQGKVTLRAPRGAYTLKLWGADPAVVVQRITVADSLAVDGD